MISPIHVPGVHAHTPGPWRVVPRLASLFNVPSGYHIASHMRDAALAHCVGHADARLMADAPELLALVRSAAQQGLLDPRPYVRAWATELLERHLAPPRSGL